MAGPNTRRIIPSPPMDAATPLFDPFERTDEGSTLLHQCSISGSPSLAKTLLSLGAQPNSRDTESWSTPLHTALLHGNLGVAFTLLEGGARLDDDEEGAMGARCGRGAFVLQDTWLSPSHCTPPPSTSRCPRDKEGATPMDGVTQSLEPLVRAMNTDRLERLGRLYKAAFPEVPSGRNRARIPSEGGRSDDGKHHGGGGGGKGKRGSRSARGTGGVTEELDPTLLSQLSESSSSSSTTAASISTSSTSSALLDAHVCTPHGDLRTCDWASLSSLSIFSNSKSALSSPLPEDVPKGKVFSLPSLFLQEATSHTLGSTSTLSSTNRASLIVPPMCDPLSHRFNESSWQWTSSIHVWGEDKHQLGFTSGNSTCLPRALDFTPIAEGDGVDGNKSVALPPKVVSVSASLYHSLFLTEGGEVYTFGSNVKGLLGIGSGGGGRAQQQQITPIPVPYFTTLKIPVAAICAGERHTLAIAAGGGVYAWGDGSSGALGIGPMAVDGEVGVGEEGGSFISTPRRVEGGLKRGGSPAIALAAGARHSVVVTEDGSAWVWGSNKTCQLGCRDYPSDTSSITTQASSSQKLAASRPWICWTPRVSDAVYSESSSSGGGGGGGAATAVSPYSTPSLFNFGEDEDTSSSSSHRPRHHRAIVGVAAAHTYTLFVTAGGEVFTCGGRGGETGGLRLVFDAAAADQADSVASFKEYSMGVATAKWRAETAASASTAAAKRPKAGGGGKGGGSKSGGGKQQQQQQQQQQRDVPASPAPTPISTQKSLEGLLARGFNVVLNEKPPSDNTSTNLGTGATPGSSGGGGGGGGSSDVVAATSNWEMSAGSRSSRRGRLAATSSSDAGIDGVFNTATVYSALRPAHITSVSAGPNHALALDSSGGVWSWGAVGHEDLLGWWSAYGSSPSTPSSTASTTATTNTTATTGAAVKWYPPRRIPFFTRGGITIVKVSAGYTHSVCVDSTGRVYTWGGEFSAARGLLGQSAHKSIPPSSSSSSSSSSSQHQSSTHAHAASPRYGVPIRVTSIAQALDVSAGGSHTLAVTGLYLPPPPPLRPSIVDTALAQLSSARKGCSGSGGDLPPVHLWDAACACTAPNTGISPEASWSRAREVLKVYAPVVREEMLQGQYFARLWGGYSSGSDGLEEEKEGSNTATFTPPSLRSLCERALVKSGVGAGVPSALALLTVATRTNSHGLGAYAGAFLSANAPAVLSFLVSHKGKDHLSTAAEACEQGSLGGGGLVRWTWTPPLLASQWRATEAQAASCRRALFKAIKARERYLIRPLGEFNDILSPGLGRGRWWVARSGGGDGRVELRLASERAGLSALHKALDAVVVADCIRTKSLLFAAEGGAGGDSNLNDSSSSTSSPVTGTRRGGAASSGGGGGGDGDESGEQRATTPTNGSGSERGHSPINVVSFQTAFASIMGSRASGGGSGGGGGGGGGSDVRRTLTFPGISGNDGDEDNDATMLLLSEGSVEAAAVAAGLRPSSPSTITSQSRLTSTPTPRQQQQPQQQQQQQPLPPHLLTTLPASTAIPSTQLSLDRLACNLAELNAGVGQSGVEALRPQGAHPTTLLPLSLAKKILTDSMVDDALGLIRRARKLQKKLQEATSLAISGVGECVGRSGGALRWMTRAPGLPLPIPTAQLEKIEKRVAWVSELGTLTLHLGALQGLVGVICGAELQGGSGGGGGGGGGAGSSSSADAAAFMAKSRALLGDLVALGDAQAQLIAVQLTPAAFLASGVTESSPFADLSSAVAMALAIGGAEAVASAASACIVGSNITTALAPPPILPPPKELVEPALPPSAPTSLLSPSEALSSPKAALKGKKGKGGGAPTPPPASPPPPPPMQVQPSPWKVPASTATPTSLPTTPASTAGSTASATKGGGGGLSAIIAATPKSPAPKKGPLSPTLSPVSPQFIPQSATAPGGSGSPFASPTKPQPPPVMTLGSIVASQALASEQRAKANQLKASAYGAALTAEAREEAELKARIRNAFQGGAAASASSGVEGGSPTRHTTLSPSLSSGGGGGVKMSLAELQREEERKFKESEKAGRSNGVKSGTGNVWGVGLARPGGR